MDTGEPTSPKVASGFTKGGSTMTASQFRTWLAQRPRVLDGGGAAELLRRGIDAAGHLWGVGALLEAPGEVRRLHRDYAAAGADILTALTFRVAPYSLRRMGLEERAEELASLAVRLAREGAAEAEKEVLVVGSMTTLEDCYRPELVPEDEVLLREHAATAHLLAAAGVDALLVETLNSLRETSAAVYVATATGLPTLVSFTCRQGPALLSGEDLTLATALADQPGVVAVGVNCTAIRDMLPALEAVAETVPLPLLAYANNGFFAEDAPHLEALPLTPERYGRCALAWLAAGARIVGGCCGTGPEHIAAVVAALPPDG